MTDSVSLDPDMDGSSDEGDTDEDDFAEGRPVQLNSRPVMRQAAAGHRPRAESQAMLARFKHLHERCRSKFSALAKLPEFGVTTWNDTYRQVFQDYTKLWDWQQRHRVVLNSAGLQRSDLGDVSSKIGQLYYNYYLRTSDTQFLKQAFDWYDAIHTRQYFHLPEDAPDDKDNLQQQLRYYGRFINVALLLQKSPEAWQLLTAMQALMTRLAELDNMGWQEWNYVISEANRCLEAETMLRMHDWKSCSAFQVQMRLPRSARNMASPVFVQDAILVCYRHQQIKIGALPLDVVRMTQALEWEHDSDSSNLGTNVVSNPRKITLYRSNVTKFHRAASHVVETLKPGRILLIYVSADCGAALTTGRPPMPPGQDAPPKRTGREECAAKVAPKGVLLYPPPRGKGTQTMVVPVDAPMQEPSAVASAPSPLSVGGAVAALGGQTATDADDAGAGAPLCVKSRGRTLDPEEPPPLPPVVAAVDASAAAAADASEAAAAAPAAPAAAAPVASPGGSQRPPPPPVPLQMPSMVPPSALANMPFNKSNLAEGGEVDIFRMDSIDRGSLAERGSQTGSDEKTHASSGVQRLQVPIARSCEQILLPLDLIGLTRRRLLLVMDSDNASAFMEVHQKALQYEPLLLLAPSKTLPRRPQSNTLEYLFTLFLANPVLGCMRAFSINPTHAVLCKLQDAVDDALELFEAAEPADVDDKEAAALFSMDRGIVGCDNPWEDVLRDKLASRIVHRFALYRALVANRGLKIEHPPRALPELPPVFAADGASLQERVRAIVDVAVKANDL